MERKCDMNHPNPTNITMYALGNTINQIITVICFFPSENSNKDKDTVLIKWFRMQDKDSNKSEIRDIKSAREYWDFLASTGWKRAKMWDKKRARNSVG